MIIIWWMDCGFKTSWKGNTKTRFLTKDVIELAMVLFGTIANEMCKKFVASLQAILAVTLLAKLASQKTCDDHYRK